VPRYGKERANTVLKTCWELDKVKTAGDVVRLLD